MTRNGIFYNLELSPYTLNYCGYIFYFSSKLHLKKYKEKINNYHEIITESLSNRFGYKINIELLSAINLYLKIESRGFLIYDYEMGVYLNCVKQVELNGGKLIKQN